MASFFAGSAQKTKFVSTFYTNSIEVYDDENLHLDASGHLETAKIYTENTPFFPFKWNQSVWVKAGTIVNFTGTNNPNAKYDPNSPVGTLFSCTIRNQLVFVTPNGRSFSIPPNSFVQFDTNSSDPNVFAKKARLAAFILNKDAVVNGQLCKAKIEYYIAEDGTMQH